MNGPRYVLYLCFLVLVLMFAFTQCNAQVRKDTVQQKQLPQDTTPLITIKDLNEIDLLLQKTFTIAESVRYETIIAKINEILATRIREYQNKKK